MQRLRVVLVMLVVALAAAAPAAALPRVSAARSRQISTLVDRFVRDVVLRKDLADGWTLAGPSLRGGTTRAAWVAGSGVSVEYFRARGRNFGNNWYPTFVSPAEIAVTVAFRSGRGKNAQMIAEQMVIVRPGGHGRWLVDELYPTAIMRLSHTHHGSCVTAKCEITGPNDFAAGAPASGPVGGAARIHGHWLWLVIGLIVGIPAAAFLGFLLHGKWRDRQALAAYAAHRRP